MNFAAPTLNLSGNSLQDWLNSGCDPGVLRPWAETYPRGTRYEGLPTGRTLVTLNVKNRDGSFRVKTDKEGRPLINNATGGFLYETRNYVTNAVSTITQEDWMLIDRDVAMAQKAELNVWADIYGTNPLNIPNGFSKMALRHTIAVGDASATISMDPIREGERSRPTMDTALIPLPVIHGDGHFSARDIAVSRDSGLPVDTTSIQLTARKIAETVEGLALGTASSYSFQNAGTIYGLINHPNRFTKSLTTPTTSNQATTLSELLDMVNTLKTWFYRGPYVLYYAPLWDTYFPLDYTTGYPKSFLSRLQEALPDIVKWKRVESLTGETIVIVDMKPSVVQGVQGMPLTTVQWNEKGGMAEFFKLMTIQVPRVRADGNGKVGINHGT